MTPVSGGFGVLLAPVLPDLGNPLATHRCTHRNTKPATALEWPAAGTVTGTTTTNAHKLPSTRRFPPTVVVPTRPHPSQTRRAA